MKKARVTKDMTEDDRIAVLNWQGAQVLSLLEKRGEWIDKRRPLFNSLKNKVHNIKNVQLKTDLLVFFNDYVHLNKALDDMFLFYTNLLSYFGVEDQDSDGN